MVVQQFLLETQMCPWVSRCPRDLVVGWDHLLAAAIHLEEGKKEPDVRHLVGVVAGPLFAVSQGLQRMPYVCQPAWRGARYAVVGLAGHGQ
eukprot:7024870-Pyramimonas_sp.AAC.1